MGLEHANTSISPDVAEDNGQPTAEVVVHTGPPTVVVRVISKPVLGGPFANRNKYNYFYGKVFINGHEMKHNGIWQRSPREAIDNALHKVTEAWMRNCDIYAADMFTDCHELHGLHNRGYWIIEGTHEDKASQAT